MAVTERISGLPKPWPRVVVGCHVGEDSVGLVIIVGRVAAGRPSRVSREPWQRQVQAGESRLVMMVLGTLGHRLRAHG